MQEFLNDFRKTIEEFTPRLQAISESDSEKKPEPDKWSAKEIMGHLIDSAANNHNRFVKAQLGDHLNFPGYEQDDWVRLQRYQKEPWSQVVQLWSLYNLHLLHVMGSVSQDQLQLSRTNHSLDQIAWQAVPADQPVTLEYFMRDYVGHLKSHLAQIFG